MDQTPTTTTRKAQRVKIDGHHAGYQFSRTTMGHRTIQTTVTDIHEERNPDYDEMAELFGKEYADGFPLTFPEFKTFGTVNWNGRTLKVVLFLEVCKLWHTVAA